MKRLLIALCLMLSSGPAYGEWTFAGGSTETGLDAYLDLETYRRNGHLVKIWELLDYATARQEAGEQYLSSMAQREYDCEEERTRMLTVSRYAGHMGHGKGVSSTVNDDLGWKPVAPGTIGQYLRKVACALKDLKIKDEQWELVTSGETGRAFYVDFDTYRRNGHLVKVWELADYVTAQGVGRRMSFSAKFQKEYDCAEKRVRMLLYVEFSGHMGSGVPVTTGINLDQWAPVQPDTISKDLWTLACMQKDRKAANSER